MREVAHGFLLCECGCLGETLLVPPLDDLGNTLVNFVADVFLRITAGQYTSYRQATVTTHLEVTLNITKQRNIAYASNDEQQRGADEDHEGEESGRR